MVCPSFMDDSAAALHIGHWASAEYAENSMRAMPISTGLINGRNLPVIRTKLRKNNRIHWRCGNRIWAKFINLLRTTRCQTILKYSD